MDIEIVFYSILTAVFAVSVGLILFWYFRRSQSAPTGSDMHITAEDARALEGLCERVRSRKS